MSITPITPKAYKEMLSSYRSGDDERDFDAALMALETDKALAAWFTEDNQFDDMFGALIQEYNVPIPPPEKEAGKKVMHYPFKRLAIAAVLILSFGFFAGTQFNQNRDKRGADLVDHLRKSMAEFAGSSFELDLMNNDLPTLRELITSKGGVFGDALEQTFKNETPMGCKIVPWKETTVSLYCFGNSQGQVIHSFVVPLEHLNGKRASRHLRPVVSYSDRDTAGFIAGNHAYLLVSSMPGVDIKPFLPPAINPPSQSASLAIILPYLMH